MKKTRRLTIRLEASGERYKYLMALQKHLEQQAGRFVPLQEVFEHVIDIMSEASNVPPEPEFPGKQ